MDTATERILRCVVIVGEGSAQTSRQKTLLKSISEDVISARSTPAAIDLVRRLCPELVVVTFHGSAAGETVQFIRSLQSVSPETPVVVVSEDPCVDHAVHFVRAGAFDYIAGPLDEKNLGRLIEGLKAVKFSDNERRQRFFCDECPAGVEIVGQSPGMVKYLDTIRLVSESRCNPVLILGETGVGKELAARAVHWWRYGDFERFIAVNCAALTSTLLESELFGHVKGAFTGADRDKTGLFEQANDGSIFLDEISEMTPELQAKLLRVLQERTFRKVGGNKNIHCNATIVASSNKNLLAETQTGKFRQDLYYRLAVFPITIPALQANDRRDDIGLLAEYFLESSVNPIRDGASRIGEEAKQRLIQHNWPGNVRELRNVIERAIILEKGDEISVSSLVFDGLETQATPEQAPASASPAQKPKKEFSLESAEREFIVRALRETGWQRTRAAALLGITRATLHAKLKRYDIQAPKKLIPENCPVA